MFWNGKSFEEFIYKPRYIVCFLLVFFTFKLFIMDRTIKVKVVKETSTKVTLLFLTLNRKIPISKADFEERVKSGLYQVIEPKEKSS